MSVLEFEGGKIKNEVDYFCESFEAEEWRSQWVEKSRKSVRASTGPIPRTPSD